MLRRPLSWQSGLLLVFLLLMDARSPGAAGRLVSEHIIVQIAAEREWLGLDSLSELERCWRFINGLTGERLPSKVLVKIAWTGFESSASFADSSISIGVAPPAAQPDMKRFLLHDAAREFTRMGLRDLSRGASELEENRFLTEGFAEILAHEFNNSTRELNGAWVIAHYLDRMKPLDLNSAAPWSVYSKSSRALSVAAPGITFLLTCRESHGRERTLKLFEALRKEKLSAALSSTFRASAAGIEETWLKRVRAFPVEDDLTATTEDDAPVLRQTVVAPKAVSPGGKVQLRLSMRDNGSNLNPGSVFVVDEASGAVLQGRQGARKDAGEVVVEIPVDSKRPPGRAGYRVCAVDEAGNVRHWKGSYEVTP